MKRLLMNRNIGFLCRSVLRFIDISACRFMACFLECFRATEDRSTSNLVSHSSLVNSKKGRESQNHLSDLFISEEKAASSPGDDKQRFVLDSIHIDKGLRDEARFLKACGTIPETPIEIRKASQKLSSPQDSGSSPFHSWISSHSKIRFHLDESSTPMKACDEEVGRPSFTSEQTPSSCVINVRDTATEVESIGTAFKSELDRSGKPMLTAGKTKSVRFECDLDQSNSLENSSSRKPEMGNKISFIVNSPNPTPLKLSDEMQTPGTIYPVNMESAGKGRPRIRSQFVHSVSSLMEDASLYKVHKDSHKSLEQIDKDEQTEISPKWWDGNGNGNGIPNSTTKYKEDHHGTPFEVRLEKTLTEEGGEKLEVMEEDEVDTNILQLQHSVQPNSVDSF